MSKEANTTSLDTIITLIKLTLDDKKVAEGRLQSVDTRLEALYEQARAALNGTGMQLVVEGGSVKTNNLNITDWRDLKIGDQIRVMVDLGDVDEQDWEQRFIILLEDQDFPGNLTIRVDRPLADGSSWVSVQDDKWEFISRP